MGQKTQERVIGENTYVCTKFLAEKGSALFHRLSRFMSAPLVMLMMGEGKGLDKQIDGEMILQGLSHFYLNCDEKTFVDTCKELMTSTLRNGKTINFNIDFAGEYAEMMQVLAFIVEVNFKSFFQGFAALKERHKAILTPVE